VLAGRWCRTVSRGEGEALAARLDCAYFETSAAEDLDSVTTAFGRVLGDVLRLHDRQPTLQVQHGGLLDEFYWRTRVVRTAEINYQSALHPQIQVQRQRLASSTIFNICKLQWRRKGFWYRR